MSRGRAPRASRGEPCAATRRRVAVLGDVGGHYGGLVVELRRLGVDPAAGVLPAGLTIVQVGDLVHRGPASEDVVALVDRCLHASPGQWVQLVGNHEALYLGRPDFRWHERIDSRSIDLLRSWWRCGAMRAATVVATADGELLVTHAGLTEGYWREVLGAPPTARKAAASLNELAADGSPEIFKAGALLGGGPPDLGAGPLWALASTELLPSWVERALPFGQVHGHSSVYDWEAGKFLVPEWIARRTELDASGGHEKTQLDGAAVIGVDPGDGEVARRAWRAWEPRLASSAAGSARG